MPYPLFPFAHSHDDDAVLRRKVRISPIMPIYPVAIEGNRPIRWRQRAEMPTDTDSRPARNGPAFHRSDEKQEAKTPRA